MEVDKFVEETKVSDNSEMWTDEIIEILDEKGEVFLINAFAKSALIAIVSIIVAGGLIYLLVKLKIRIKLKNKSEIQEPLNPN